jgi:hypothetical protein
MPKLPTIHVDKQVEIWIIIFSPQSEFLNLTINKLDEMEKQPVIDTLGYATGTINASHLKVTQHTTVIGSKSCIVLVAVSILS